MTENELDDFMDVVNVLGRDAVNMVARIVVMNTDQGSSDLPLIALFGSAVSMNGTKLVLPENEGFHELWECEITIKPIRKFSAHRKGDKKGDPSYSFNGYRADQMMVSALDNFEGWGDQYYGKPKATPTEETS